MTVIKRLNAIIGAEVRQADLLRLRKTAFAEILGRPTRSEARVRLANESVYEAHKSEILPLLDDPNVIREIIRVALSNRTKQAEKEAVEKHALTVV
jgi:hypothetical protein